MQRSREVVDAVPPVITKRIGRAIFNDFPIIAVIGRSRANATARRQPSNTARS
jgi:hypothetical protein